MRPLNIWLPAVRAGSGADVFIERLAQGLQEAGHKPLVQWFTLGHELTPWRLARVPAPVDADLVHAGSWQGFAFRRPGLPLVVTEHQYVNHPAFLTHRRVPQALYHKLWVDRWVRRSYRAADALVAVSGHVAQAMREDGASKVEIIHNWIDCRWFTPIEPRRRDEGEPFRLLFVGNPSRCKGVDVLPALAEQLGEGFEIRCLGGLRRGFDASRWPGNMRLLERVPPQRMPEVYHAVDAVLVPSRYEAFGYVALEAMACGLPVLGFANPGTAEVVVHGQTALLAPVDDLAQLAAQARQLAASPALCQRLGQAGRERAVAGFDQAAGIGAYVALYQRVLSRRHDC